MLCVTGLAAAQTRKPAAAARPQPRELKIAVLLTSDKVATASTLAGLDAARKHHRLSVAMRVTPRPDDADALIESLAAVGPDLIVGVGGAFTDAFRAASARHPDGRFLLLDGAVETIDGHGPSRLLTSPNVRSVTFRAGVVAGAVSARGAVGFVGGMETPALQAIECGYETGVRWAARELKRTVRGSMIYVGHSPDALTDPAHAAKVTRTMIAEKHVDVVYPVAGGSSAGAVEAARAAKIKLINYDGEPGPLTGDLVITSGRRRFDRAVERAIADVAKRTFGGGVTEMTLANGGVDLLLPGRLAPATRKLVDRARAAIVSAYQAPCIPYEEPPLAWDFPPRPAAP